MGLRVGDRVLVRKYEGTAKPLRPVVSAENYWRLIGELGRVVQDPTRRTLYHRYAARRYVFVQFSKTVFRGLIPHASMPPRNWLTHALSGVAGHHVQQRVDVLKNVAWMRVSDVVPVTRVDRPVRQTIARLKLKRIRVPVRESLMHAAMRGVPDAQYALGMSYLRRSESRANAKKAVLWLRRAARSPQDGVETSLMYNDARMALAYLHMFGIGVRRNPQTAVEWFKRAASLDAQAAFSLWLCYSGGIGVRRNRRVGLGWLKKATRCGVSGPAHLEDGLQKLLMEADGVVLKVKGQK